MCNSHISFHILCSFPKLLPLSTLETAVRYACKKRLSGKKGIDHQNPANLAQPGSILFHKAAIVCHLPPRFLDLFGGRLFGQKVERGMVDDINDGECPDFHPPFRPVGAPGPEVANPWRVFPAFGKVRRVEHEDALGQQVLVGQDHGKLKPVQAPLEMVVVGRFRKFTLSAHVQKIHAATDAEPQVE